MQLLRKTQLLTRIIKSSNIDAGEIKQKITSKEKLNVTFFKKVNNTIINNTTTKEEDSEKLSTRNESTPTWVSNRKNWISPLRYSDVTISRRKKYKNILMAHMVFTQYQFTKLLMANVWLEPSIYKLLFFFFKSDENK